MILSILLVFTVSEHNSRMTYLSSDGQVGRDATTQKGFLSFSREWGELLFQTKFLVVGTSLEHLSMKKLFSIGATVLSLKLDKERGLGVWQPTPHWVKIDLCSNHKDAIQSKQNLVCKFGSIKIHYQNNLMTIQSKTTSQWHHQNFGPKQWENEDFDPKTILIYQ